METPTNKESHVSIGKTGQEQWNPDPNQPTESNDEGQENPSYKEKEEVGKWPIDQNAYEENQQDEVHEEFLTPSGNTFNTDPPSKK